MTWTFSIDGVPAPQGSKTCVPRGGRCIPIEGGSTVGRKKHRAWRAAVSAAAEQQVWRARGGIDPDSPIEVSLAFRMPQTSSVWRVGWHTVKPDLDKLVRSTVDGLAEGGLFPHDQRVASFGRTTKRWVRRGEQPGVDVTVDVLHDGEAA